jgi:hypothetical protein
LAKKTYLNYFSPSLEVGYYNFFGVEFWLTTTLVFKKIQFGKKNIFKLFFSLFRSWLLQIVWG